MLTRLPCVYMPQMKLDEADVAPDAPVSLPCSGVRLPPPKLMPVGTQTGVTLEDEAEFLMELGASQLASEQLSALGFIGATSVKDVILDEAVRPSEEVYRAAPGAALGEMEVEAGRLAGGGVRLAPPRLMPVGNQTVGAVEDEASYNRDVGARVQHPIPPSFVCATPLNDAEVVADVQDIGCTGVRLPPPRLYAVGFQSHVDMEEENGFRMDFGLQSLDVQQLLTIPKLNDARRGAAIDEGLGMKLSATSSPDHGSTRDMALTFPAAAMLPLQEVQLSSADSAGGGVRLPPPRLIAVGRQSVSGAREEEETRAMWGARRPAPANVFDEMLTSQFLARQVSFASPAGVTTPTLARQVSFAPPADGITPPSSARGHGLDGSSGGHTRNELMLNMRRSSTREVLVPRHDREPGSVRGRSSIVQVERSTSGAHLVSSTPSPQRGATTPSPLRGGHDEQDGGSTGEQETARSIMPKVSQETDVLEGWGGGGGVRIMPGLLAVRKASPNMRAHAQLARLGSGRALSMKRGSVRGPREVNTSQPNGMGAPPSPTPSLLPSSLPSSPPSSPPSSLPLSPPLSLPSSPALPRPPPSPPPSPSASQPPRSSQSPAKPQSARPSLPKRQLRQLPTTPQPPNRAQAPVLASRTSPTPTVRSVAPPPCGNIGSGRTTRAQASVRTAAARTALATCSGDGKASVKRVAPLLPAPPAGAAPAGSSQRRLIAASSSSSRCVVPLDPLAAQTEPRTTASLCSVRCDEGHVRPPSRDPSARQVALAASTEEADGAEDGMADGGPHHTMPPQLMVTLIAEARRVYGLASASPQDGIRLATELVNAYARARLVSETWGRVTGYGRRRKLTAVQAMLWPAKRKTADREDDGEPRHELHELVRSAVDGAVADERVLQPDGEGAVDVASTVPQTVDELEREVAAVDVRCCPCSCGHSKHRQASSQGMADGVNDAAYTAAKWRRSAKVAPMATADVDQAETAAARLQGMDSADEHGRPRLATGSDAHASAPAATNNLLLRVLQDDSHYQLGVEACRGSNGNQ